MNNELQLPANATEEQKYLFEERVGLCIDSHATEDEAVRWAYRETFGCEPPLEHEQKEML